MSNLPVKISVIMPVYNAESYLREALDSALGQSFHDFELVCVNDGSTDGSLKILEEYASRDSRIKLYSKPNGGIPAITVNYGVDRSHGDYIFILNADDYLSLDLLQNTYKRAKETDADAVLPEVVFVSEKGVRGQAITGLKGDKTIVLTNREAVVQSLDWTIHTNALWRGSLIRKIRLEEFGTSSDEYTGRVLFLNCNKVVFSEGSYFYRQNDQSITRKTSAKIFDRPYTTYRLAFFLEENSFDDGIVRNAYITAFKTVVSFYSLFIRTRKELSTIDRKVAENKIKTVYDLINRGKVRKYLFREHGTRKYGQIILTFSNWWLLKRSLLAHEWLKHKKA